MATQLAPVDIDAVIERALTDLPSPAWRVTDTRRGGRTPRPDFVVVGPPGVFVIGRARPHDKPRTRAKLAMSLLAASDDVARATGVRRDEVHPILCLTGHEVADGWSRGVTVCAAATLVDTLTLRRDLLSADEVAAAARAVGRSSKGSGKHRA